MICIHILLEGTIKSYTFTKYLIIWQYNHRLFGIIFIYILMKDLVKKIYKIIYPKYLP